MAQEGEAICLVWAMISFQPFNIYLAKDMFVYPDTVLRNPLWIDLCVWENVSKGFQRRSFRQTRSVSGYLGLCIQILHLLRDMQNKKKKVINENIGSKAFRGGSVFRLYNFIYYFGRGFGGCEYGGGMDAHSM